MSTIEPNQVLNTAIKVMTGIDASSIWRALNQNNKSTPVANGSFTCEADWAKTEKRWTPRDLASHYMQNMEYNSVKGQVLLLLKNKNIPAQDRANLKNMLEQQAVAFNNGKYAAKKGNYQDAKAWLGAEFCIIKDLRDMITSLEQYKQSKNFKADLKYV